MNKNISTDIVPIYNELGEKLDEFKLPEKIMPIPSKRGGFSENGIYYKGSGIVYRYHLTNEVSEYNKGKLNILGNTGIIYEQYLACYPKLVGKFGIFTFPHQFIFTDFEGGCGKKEMRIIENQKKFKYSAIDEIIDVIPTGIKDHNVYVYRMKESKGGMEDTVNLIEYVLLNDLNTAWDKNLWGDIYAYGYVRDIADWFVSKKINHKIGTVYALLNSLYRADLWLYANLLLKYFGKYSFEKYKILYYSGLIVKKYCPKLIEEEKINMDSLNQDTYGRLLELLFSGKACCHLENKKKFIWVYEYYEKVKQQYMKKLFK